MSNGPEPASSTENSPPSSSGTSWTTPVSTRFSSSSSWNTPKSSGDERLMTSGESEVDGKEGTSKIIEEKVSGETEVLDDEDDTDEKTLIESPPHSTIRIPDEDPPPYSEDWTPRRIEFSLESSTDLIPKPLAIASPVRDAVSRCSTERMFRIRQSPGMSIRIYPEEHLEGIKERDTFAQKYGTICIVAFFVVFLMILSLIAKFLVNKTLRS